MSQDLNNLLEKTKQLIEQEKYQDVLDLLNKEIKNPLYDLDEQKIIQDRINVLNKFLKQISIDIRWEKADKNGLIKIFNTEGYEIAVLDKLFDKFGSSLTNTDYLKLQQVFLDDSVSNEMKVAYLNLFKDYGVNYKFDYHNTCTNKTFKVDVSKDFSLESNDLLFALQDKLNALYFKETSKENLAKQIVNSIYCYYFNTFDLIPYEVEDLFNKLVDYIEHAFAPIYKVDKEFSDWINLMLGQ